MGYDRGPTGRTTCATARATTSPIISTVNCSASTSKYIAERVRAAGLLKQYPERRRRRRRSRTRQGCAMQYDGPDHQQLDRTLAGFARHPNVAAYILVGLGCETGQAIAPDRERGADPAQRRRRRSTPLVLTIQECGGIGKTVEAGVKAVAELLPRVNDVRRVAAAGEAHHPRHQLRRLRRQQRRDRQPGPRRRARPARRSRAARASSARRRRSTGPSTCSRAGPCQPEVGEKLVERIKWWEWYTGIFGAEINNNPSPGNKEGGLTTIYEKSLGAIAKGGSTAMVDVVRYAEPVTAKGFVVMDTPGYDPVSMTGIVAGGANVLRLHDRPRQRVRLQAGPVDQGGDQHAAVQAHDRRHGHQRRRDPGRRRRSRRSAGEIFEEILAVASGKKTKSEINGVGEEEFAPWTIGPTL